MIPAALAPYKAWLLASAAVALFGAGIAVGWTGQGWRKDAEVMSLKAHQSGQAAKDAGDALEQFKTTAAAISFAASSAQAANASTAAVLRTIRQEMKNATPLPADCHPDAERLRKRNAAIEAYNNAATGRLPSGALQDH